MRRSGVGRMTLEIARAARHSAEIGWTGLLLPEGIECSSAIDAIDEPASRIVERKPIAWKVAVGRVPGVQFLRQIKHGGLNRKVSAASRACQGRLVYHEPNMIARPISLPTVVTINDLSWHHQPSWHPAERLRWIDANLQATMRRARRFVAISQFTKDAVVRDLGVPADRIDVVPLAPAAEFQPVSQEDAAEALARFELQDRSYVFSISTIEPRKNFDRLLAAHLRLPEAIRGRAPLVIAGGKGWGDVLARPEAQAAIRDGTVRLLGHVSDRDLTVLCARAAVFAYVSLYEGLRPARCGGDGGRRPRAGVQYHRRWRVGRRCGPAGEPGGCRRHYRGAAPHARGQQLLRSVAPSRVAARRRILLAADDRCAAGHLAACAGVASITPPVGRRSRTIWVSCPAAMSGR